MSSKPPLSSTYSNGPLPQPMAGDCVLVGSETFTKRVRELVRDCQTDPAVPELGQLRSKPSLETIREVVAEEESGVDGADWAKGRRSDNVSRVVAAYLARRCFAY